MKKIFLLLLSLLGVGASYAQEVWISEIEYDNVGADTLEYIEIAGIPGTNLNNYQLLFVNGGSNEVYHKMSLNGYLPASSASFVEVVFYPNTAIQNGPSDGVALIKDDTIVVEFLSYEGLLVNVILFQGDTNTYNSIDIGVSDNTILDVSMQRIGDASSTNWIAATPTPSLLKVVGEPTSPAKHPVWINEIDYDNPGGSDDMEFIEIAGKAGESLSDYKLLLVNGSNNTVYQEYPLFGNLPEGDSISALAFFMTPSFIQNGSPDGVALVKGDTNVIQFLSYEGQLVDVELFLDYPQQKYTSIDIGLQDNNEDDVSAQLIGNSAFPPFEWILQAPSPGDLNSGQGNVIITSADILDVTRKVEVVAIYNLMGESLSEIPANQPVIIRYSDGSTKKVMNVNF